MTDVAAELRVSTTIDLRPEWKRTIGIVGAGVVVDCGHLIAYHRAGLHVGGIFDIDAPRAREVAGRHGIGRVYGTLDELAADEAIEVVTIAVPAGSQPEIARALAAAGKHLLCEKPLALDVAAAAGVVDACARAGVRLAVNQQMRYSAGIATAREITRRGWIGRPLEMSFRVLLDDPWRGWPWLAAEPRLDLLYHSIHYLDSVRAVLGDPERVWCAAQRGTARGLAGENVTTSVLSYADGARAVVDVSHEAPPGINEGSYRIAGTSGVVDGHIGHYDAKPAPDALTLRSLVVGDGTPMSVPVEGLWVPDAFIGPMSSLLAAIATGSRAETEGADNLRTMRLVDALYRSIVSGRAEAVSIAG